MGSDTQSGSATFTKCQCGSSVAQNIKAPLHLVWSLVRRFDTPHSYKRFVRSCTMQEGCGGVGSVRKIIMLSGLSNTNSIERLDMLDDELHIMQFTIVGGDSRLKNYQSTTELREVSRDGSTQVIESYLVDVPMDSNKEDTCVFANTIIGFDLKALAKLVERTM